VADEPRGTYADAIERLAFAQKGSRNAPAYSRWVNRPLGRRFAAMAYVAGLTPDRVTGISACFTFAGIGLLAAGSPTPALGLAVALLLVVGYALDSADGQLARLRGGGSPRGEWLDHVTDAVKNASVHLAVAISWYRSGDADLFGHTSSSLLLIPLAYAVVWSTQFYAKSLTDQLRLQHGGPPAPATPAGVAQAAPWQGSIATLPNDYGLLCLVLGMIGFAALFTSLYLGLLLASTLFLAASLRRWSRELRGQ
jgi:CDP-alcohol phosphatidyltransferase